MAGVQGATAACIVKGVMMNFTAEDMNAPFHEIIGMQVMDALHKATNPETQEVDEDVEKEITKAEVAEETAQEGTDTTREILRQRWA